MAEPSEGQRYAAPSAVQPQMHQSQHPSQANAGATEHAPIYSALKEHELERTRRAQEEASTTIFPKRKLESLVQQLDKQQTIDAEAEELLVDIAHDFIEQVVGFACSLAKHRGSDILEAKDVQLHLERNWNIRVAGFAHEVHSAGQRRPSATHDARLAAIKKDAAVVNKRKTRPDLQ